MITLENQRKLEYDVMRICAAFAVVMLHSTSILITEQPNYDANFWIINFLNGVSRIGVPFFLMISGALFLNEERQITFRKIFKQVTSILILISCWSVFYASFLDILIPMSKNKPINIQSFLENLLLGHFHMWYLYMVIGIYLATPLIRLWTCKKNVKYIRYFIFLALMSNFTFPLLNFLIRLLGGTSVLLERLHSQFNFSFFNIYITYYLTGWYLTAFNLKENKHKKYFWLCALSLLLNVCGTYYYMSRSMGYYDYFYQNNNIIVYVYCTSAFRIMYQWLNNRRTSLRNNQNIILRMSSLTFGVYILHPVIQLAFLKLFYLRYQVWYLLLFYGFTVLASLVGTIFISKLPLFRKLVRL